MDHVIVTKCLLQTKYKQRLHRREANKVLRLKGTPQDTLWRLYNSLNLITQFSLLDMYEVMVNQNMSCRIKYEFVCFYLDHSPMKCFLVGWCLHIHFKPVTPNHDWMLTATSNLQYLKKPPCKWKEPVQNL